MERRENQVERDRMIWSEVKDWKKERGKAGKKKRQKQEGGGKGKYEEGMRESGGRKRLEERIKWEITSKRGKDGNIQK